MILKRIALGLIFAMAMSLAAAAASAQQEVAPDRFERGDGQVQQPTRLIRAVHHKSRSSNHRGRGRLRAQLRSYLARQRRVRAHS
jgi:hypothetical protein